MLYLPDWNFYGVKFTPDGVLDYSNLGPVDYYVDADSGAYRHQVDPYSDSMGLKAIRVVYPLHSGEIFGVTTSCWCSCSAWQRLLQVADRPLHLVEEAQVAGRGAPRPEKQTKGHGMTGDDIDPKVRDVHRAGERGVHGDLLGDGEADFPHAPRYCRGSRAAPWRAGGPAMVSSEDLAGRSVRRAHPHPPPATNRCFPRWSTFTAAVGRPSASTPMIDSCANTPAAQAAR